MFVCVLCGKKSTHPFDSLVFTFVVICCQKRKDSFGITIIWQCVCSFQREKMRCQTLYSITTLFICAIVCSVWILFLIVVVICLIPVCRMRHLHILMFTYFMYTHTYFFCNLLFWLRHNIPQHRRGKKKYKRTNPFFFCGLPTCITLCMLPEEIVHAIKQTNKAKQTKPNINQDENEPWLWL